MCGCCSWNSCCPRPCVRCCISQVTLSGAVTNQSQAVSNLPIAYTINGVAYTTSTNAQGRFSITAPLGAQVVITPQPGLGVTVTPSSLTVAACQDRADLNFTLSPLT